MKKIRILAGLVAMLPFFTSCDNHTFEDYSWHSWIPGMVYCTNGDVVSYEKCMGTAMFQRLCCFMSIKRMRQHA